MFETSISDLINQKYSVVNDFFSSEEVVLLRESLLAKYEAGKFKNSVLRNRVNDEIDKTIRGNFILGMDEKTPMEQKTYF
ncbi:hypothetical protein [Aequorivita xiaoshiensis]|uniref:hypothetical protein n=1 Tax=Aequorivita xiaoshiensis TaxID=2874476 RepID=UPI0030B9E19B